MKKQKRPSPVFMIVDGLNFVWTASASRDKDGCYDALGQRGLYNQPSHGERIVEYRPYLPRKPKPKKKAKRRA